MEALNTAAFICLPDCGSVNVTATSAVKDIQNLQGQEDLVAVSLLLASEPMQGCRLPCSHISAVYSTCVHACMIPLTFHR